MSLITINVGSGGFKTIQDMVDQRLTDFGALEQHTHYVDSGGVVTASVIADGETYFFGTQGAILENKNWSFNFDNTAGDAFFGGMFFGLNAVGTRIDSIAYNSVFTTVDLFLYPTNMISSSSFGSYVLRPIPGGDGTTYWEGFSELTTTFYGAIKSYVQGNHAALDNLMAAQQYVFNGNDSDDHFVGGNFADTITGGRGSNHLEGGLGNDLYILGDGADWITDAGGRDTVQFTHASQLDWVDNQFTGDIAGDAFNWDTMEVFKGSTGNDAIRMGAWDTRGVEMWGNGGNDTLTGTQGNDVMRGGADSDNLRGEKGNDSIVGGDGDDFLDGGAGNDTLVGGLGRDTANYGNRAQGLLDLGWTFDLRTSILVPYGTAKGSSLGGSGIFNTLVKETDRLYSVENIVGTIKYDTFYINNSHDVSAGDGNDSIFVNFAASSIVGVVDGGLGTGDTIDFSSFGTTRKIKIELSDTYLVGASANAFFKLPGTSPFAPWTAMQRVDRVENVVGTGLGDYIEGNSSANVIRASGGNDTVVLRSQTTGEVDNLYGGAGVDLLDLSVCTAAVRVALAPSTATNPVDNVFTSDNVSINTGTQRTIAQALGFEDVAGSAYDDLIAGNDVANNLAGFGGADTVSGGAGADTISGGFGRDVLTGGLAGNAAGDGVADVFAFYSASESGNTFATADVITDFVHLVDRIDLSAIDAIATTGANDAFTFIGTAAFSGIGQLRYQQSGGNTYISGDVNGDNTADFMIALNGNKTLTAADFVR